MAVGPQFQAVPRPSISFPNRHQAHFRLFSQPTNSPRPR